MGGRWKGGREDRADPEPRNWHRNGDLVRPNNFKRVLEEKTADKIQKYMEMHRGASHIDFVPATPPPVVYIPSSCDAFSSRDT